MIHWIIKNKFSKKIPNAFVHRGIKSSSSVRELERAGRCTIIFTYLHISFSFFIFYILDLRKKNCSDFCQFSCNAVFSPEALNTFLFNLIAKRNYNSFFWGHLDKKVIEVHKLVEHEDTVYKE